MIDEQGNACVHAYVHSALAIADLPWRWGWAASPHQSEAHDAKAVTFVLGVPG